MNELTVKNKIIRAMQEPAVPDRLVQRTIVRGRAVSAGVRAEVRLEREEGSLSLSERVELAAVSLVGRLATVSQLPEGAEPETLAAQLAGEPRFVRAVEGGNVLARLKSGELLKTTLREPVKRESPAPERKGPEVSGPGR